MAARVIHFGVDACYRLNVLRRAGYEVDVCSNLLQFGAALQSGPDADAVVLNDADGSVPLTAISMARSQSPAPIVLFSNGDRTYSFDEIDLVVPCFTLPEEWLLDLAEIIVRTRALRACSALLREQSQLARREAVSNREKSRHERGRSEQQRRCKPSAGFRGRER